MNLAIPPQLKEIFKRPWDTVANFLNMRTTREKLLIVGFVGVAAFCLDLVLWLMPVAHVFSETLPRLSSVQTELKGLKQDQTNGEVIQKRWETLSQEFSEKEKSAVSSNQVPALLESLSKLAVTSGVKITSLKSVEAPKAPGRKYYFPVQIQISALAGTHQLGAFLSRLETSSTFFRIMDLKILSNPTDERRHLVELLIETERKA